MIRTSTDCLEKHPECCISRELPPAFFVRHSSAKQNFFSLTMVLAINGVQCPTRCCRHGGMPLGSRSAKRLRTRDAQPGGLCCVLQPPAKLQRASISRRASKWASAEAGSGQATQPDPPARHAEVMHWAWLTH